MSRLRAALDPKSVAVIGASSNRNKFGNKALRESLGIKASVLVERAEELRTEGQTVLFMIIDGRPAGLFGVADPIKESAAAAIDAWSGMSAIATTSVSPNAK